MHDQVVSWGRAHFPAWKRQDGMLVDLRLFPKGSQSTTEMVYRPDELLSVGVPDNIVKAAAESMPPGFVLLA
jgi:hypothetical protein